MQPSNTTRPLLYVVDDDVELRSSVEQYLQRHGIEVIGFSNADAMLRRLPRRRPSLIVLDLMMPGTGGLEALGKLRREGDDIPVILLTARSDIEDRILGLTAGADDYMGKPFSVRELLARIQAVLKRLATPIMRGSLPGEIIQFGAFTLDPRKRTLSRDGRPIDLRASDLSLLQVLASHPYVSLTRERLVEMTGARISDKSERSIDAQIVRLRGIVEENPGTPRVVQTVRGVGYVFVPPDP